MSTHSRRTDSALVPSRVIPRQFVCILGCRQHRHPAKAPAPARPFYEAAKTNRHVAPIQGGTGQPANQRAPCSCRVDAACHARCSVSVVTDSPTATDVRAILSDLALYSTLLYILLHTLPCVQTARPGSFVSPNFCRSFIHGPHRHSRHLSIRTSDPSGSCPGPILLRTFPQKPVLSSTPYTSPRLPRLAPPESLGQTFDISAMKSSRSLLFLGSVLLCLCLSYATAMAQAPIEIASDDIHDAIVLLDRRQNDNSTTGPPVVVPPTTPQTSSTKQNPPSSTPLPPAVEQSTAPSTSRTTTSPNPPPTSKPQTTTTKHDEKPTFTPQTTPTTILSTSIVIMTVTNTAPDGQKFTSIATSTSVSTSVGMVTSTPDKSGSDGGGGLSKSQKNIVIGVVVGVGGAIILGGMAIVLWRLKKKRTNPVDEDDLMRRDGSPLAAGDATSSPFQTTLDQYHKPTGPVNASSNF